MANSTEPLESTGPDQSAGSATGEPNKNRLALVFAAAVGFIAINGALIVAFQMGQSSSSSQTETLGDSTETLGDSTQTLGDSTQTRRETTEAPSTSAESSTALEAVTTSSVSTTDTTTDTTTDPTPTEVDEAEPAEANVTEDVDTITGVDGNRQARLNAGVLTLEGVVPSEEIGNEIASRAAVILGEQNVINNYSVDPEIPFADSGPLIVEDLVLFSSGSTAINPEFIPLLDLGTVLLTQFPNVSITVVAHTDAVGPADQNMALSQARGEAVVAYWTNAGGDADRVIVDARGETDLLVPTDEAELANRRVEFIITGLLD